MSKLKTTPALPPPPPPTGKKKVYNYQLSQYLSE
jgi:hypothetical protein